MVTDIRKLNVGDTIVISGKTEKLTLIDNKSDGSTTVVTVSQGVVS